MVDITCPRLVFHVISNTSSLSLDPLRSGSCINVTCPTGLRFNNKQTSMVTTCDVTGNWNPPVPDCTGKLNLNSNVKQAHKLCRLENNITIIVFISYLNRPLHTGDSKNDLILNISEFWQCEMKMILDRLWNETNFFEKCHSNSIVLQNDVYMYFIIA